MTAQLPLFAPAPKPSTWGCYACEWFSGSKCHEAIPWVTRDPMASACDRLVVRGPLRERRAR